MTIPYSLDRLGPEWGTGEPQHEHPYGQQLFTWTSTAAGVGTGVFLFGNRRFGQDTGFTYAYKAASVFEKVSPFQIASTFRLSSIISPFAEVEKIARPESVEGSIVKLGKEFLGTRTADYLSATTGLSHDELIKRGALNELNWRRTGRYTGQLFSIADDGRERVVANNIALLHARDARSKGLNRFAQAYLSVLDQDLAESISGLPKGKSAAKQTVEEAAKSVFGKEVVYSEFIPIGDKGISRKLKTMGAFGASMADHGKGLFAFTSYLRSLPAFALQRTNELVRQLTSPIPALQKVLTVKEGPALAMSFRYAGKVVAIGGAWKLLEQIDWMKRQGGFGEVAAAGGYGTLAGFAAKKLLGASKETAAIVGLGGALLSFAPTFDQGSVVGTATLGTKLQMLRAKVTNLPLLKDMPIVGHDSKQWLEETMPGITQPTMAALAGGVAWAGLNGWHFYHGREPFPIHKWEFKQRLYDMGYTLNPMSGANKADGTRTWFSAVTEAWSQASHNVDDTLLSSRRAAQRDLDRVIAKDIGDTKGFFSKALAQIKGAIKGGGAEVDSLLEEMGKGARALPASQNALRFLIPAAGFALVTGALASDETPEELQDLYSGKQLVAVRKGRWWEGGGTPYEGTKVSFWKPHWYRLMTTRAKEKALWGPDEDEISPVYKTYLENFTYELERRNYYNRPFPITGEGFDSVPVVGWLLKPLGRLFKPARLMHAEDWTRVGADGGIDLLNVRESTDSNPVYSMGGLESPTPVSPFAFGPTANRVVRQWQDLGGIVGYVGSLIMKATGGTERPFGQDRWLESADRMASFERDFWEANLGGLGTLSEPIRRFFPKHEFNTDLYNPIPNTMPDWIPQHMRRGDPMTTMDFGEVRFPGAGYAALYPELAGVDPEKYPLIHQYNILADVAPWSPQFRRIQATLQAQAKQGLLPIEDVKFINSTNNRLRTTAERRDYMSDVSDYNEDTKNWGVFRKAIGSAYRGILTEVKRMAEPIENAIFLSPRPFSKLMPFGNVVDEYESNQVYGTENAFWDKPWRDWFRPALHTAAHNWGGWDGIPGWRQKVRDTTEYFDKLEYYKWNRLAQDARKRGDTRLATQYEGLKKKTITGVNPYSDLRSIMQVVPYDEKDYFFKITKERDPENRERILQLVPEYMRNIYVAQWQITDFEATQDQRILDEIRTSKREIEESKVADLAAFFKENPLPRPDWIGFNPAVDLEDIKLKMIQETDQDIHDYGMWESQEAVLARKPYVTSDALEGLEVPGQDLRSITYDVLKAYGITSDQADIHVNSGRAIGSRTDININYNDTRKKERAKYNRSFE